MVAMALLLAMLASTPFAAASSWSLPGCQATCGGVDIPYPFGIGPKCFRPGFEIACNSSTPYLAGTAYKVLNLSLTPSGARVELPIAWACYDVSGGRGRRSSESQAPVEFNPHGVYRISDARNQLYVIGCDNTAYIQSQKDNSIYGYEYYTGCVSYCRTPESVKNGSCAGVGCCRVDIPPNLTDNSVGVDTDNEESLAVRAVIHDFSPCSYGFLVDRDSYTFNKADLKMDKEKMMPVWLDWAIRPDVSSKLLCSEAKNNSQYACKSRNSTCVDVAESPGYTCVCSRGFEGNAYIDDGCTDIDECLHTRTYPCFGVCHNTEGSYECKCKRGSHGNPLREPCDPDFSHAAKISIGVICGMSCLIALLIFIIMKNEKRKLQAFFERNGGPVLASINNIKIFTKQELSHITGNYKTVLGKGSLGNVYLGSINENLKVAVKCSISVKENRNSEFANEIEIQSNINHRNIIRLIGCCLEVDIPMLVYEFAPRGSLSYILHETKDDTKVSLPLGTRLDIAVDSAEGLSYMHSSAAQKVLHGDVKSGNILLDENFMPKVSDFGTSRLLSIEKKHTISVVGDMNYIDPVYMKTGCLDEKSDVYSFGVVLLELITRKKPRYDGNKSLLINFIKSYTSDERAREMYDAEITSPENVEFLEKVGSIAVACLKEDMDERPNMKQVAEHLQLVRREWKQKQGSYSDQVANGISMESPDSLTMDATDAEIPGYCPLLK